jgi:prepilin-type N-terminal cleavage/methylation domain-containing protein
MNKKLIHTKIADQTGFTILELLIALAIFSIGFMAVGALQTGALRAVTTSQGKTLAMEVLKDHAEELKRTPLYARDIWRHPGGPATFQLSAAFVETNNADPDWDYQVVDGDYTVTWWIDTPHTIPNRWLGGAAIITSENITMTVVRNGDDPEDDALHTIQFVKYWATDN